MCDYGWVESCPHAGSSCGEKGEEGGLEKKDYVDSQDWIDSIASLY